MNEQFEKLVSLIECLPALNSARAYSELNSILSTYSSVLNDVSNYSDEYKRTASLHFPELSTIRENIQLSLEDTSKEEKAQAFERARNELKTNIHALASLIKPREEFAAVS